jgi:uncharacterized protein
MDLSDLPVVDGHCHPLLADPWAVPLETFLNLFSEGRPGTMSTHVLHTAYFRRALGDLAGRLHCELNVQAVLDRRRGLGPEGARRALTDSRIEALLVDTGYPTDGLPLGEMRRLVACAVHEVFRIETCAERLLTKALPYEAFLEAFRSELRAAAERAVAFKTIIAYRSGLAVQPWTPAAAAQSYGEVLARLDSDATRRSGTGGTPRLTEKPLLDTLFTVTLEVARETERPLQIHAGFGDPDIDVLQANPALLRPVLEDARWSAVRVVILHLAYPYFREAAFMTAVWPQVYLDLSLALPFLGAGAVGPLVEVLSLAPWSKLLYGSDLQGIPELFALSADWARDALGEALEWLRERRTLSGEDGHAIARAILAGNARTLYGLPPTAA